MEMGDKLLIGDIVEFKKEDYRIIGSNGTTLTLREELKPVEGMLFSFMVPNHKELKTIQAPIGEVKLKKSVYDNFYLLRNGNDVRIASTMGDIEPIYEDMGSVPEIQIYEISKMKLKKKFIHA